MEYVITIREEVEYDISLDATDAEDAIEKAKEILDEMHRSPHCVDVDITESKVMEVYMTGEE